MLSVYIADDEIMVRRSLRRRLAMVPAALNYLGDAGNGREALELYRQKQPDIFIVDIRMPEMGGLELIKTINALHPGNKTCFIIISGYEDFAYMQQAIRLGVNDYLKKPIIQEELNNAISRAHDRINSSKDDKSITTNNAIISFEEFSKKTNLEQKPEKQALLMVVRNAEKSDLKEAYNLFESYDMHAISVRWSESVSLFYIETIPTLKEISKIAGQLSELCETLVYGTIEEQSVFSAFEQADMAMNVCFVDGTKTAICFNKYENKEKSKMDLELLKSALMHGEANSCRKIINRMFEKITKTQEDVLRLGFVYRDIVLLLLTQFAAINKPAPRMLEKDLLLFSTARFSSFESICGSLVAYCEDFIHLVVHKKQNKELANMVCDFINQHYMDELPLQEIADYFFISPNYLCKRFKEKKQCTISSYIEDVRMEKACGLLSSTAISISEVCRLTGYNDVTYFARTFKKCYSITPSQYRKNNKTT